MPVLTVEKPLKKVLGDDGTDSLIRLLNQVQKEQKEDILQFVEEKFERKLIKEISGVREEISGVNERITNEISSVRVDMHKNQANLLKWMFIFWISQIGTILGFLYMLLK